jgi:hypothetical protein
VLRADSGFYNSKVNRCLQQGQGELLHHGQGFQEVEQVIVAIPEQAWTPIPYWIGDGADVAETTYHPFSEKHSEVRLIVRRVRPTPGS